MVVRFDHHALRQTVEHIKEPIGVEGDPASMKKGGISEADAIVKEARKSMGDAGLDGSLTEDERKRLSKEIIMEGSEKEPDPEIGMEYPVLAKYLADKKEKEKK